MKDILRNNSISEVPTCNTQQMYRLNCKYVASYTSKSVNACVCMCVKCLLKCVYVHMYNIWPIFCDLLYLWSGVLLISLEDSPTVSTEA